MLHLKGTVCLCWVIASERLKKRKFQETHKTTAPGVKYLPSSGNTVSSDLAISSVARIAATDIQIVLKAMWRPGQILTHQRKNRISLQTVLRRLKTEAPPAKSKDDIPRISNVLVQSTIFDETFRLECFSVGINFLVTSHAPMNAG
jgi:hypothetical protein